MSCAKFWWMPVVVCAAIALSGLSGCVSAPVGSNPMPLSQGQDRSAEAAAPPRNSQQLRVMSFNVRMSTIFDLQNTWGLRKDVLVRSIRAFHPDLLGTQECELSQVRYLRRHLGAYGFVGAGRDDGATDGEMVAIFYRKAKFTLEAKGHFWLSDWPTTPGSETWDGMLPRMVTWAKLRRRATQEPLYFFNTHFSAFGEGARWKSARLLRRRIHRIAGTAPVVVTGDFNAGENSRPYNIMLDGGRPHRGFLADTFRDVFPHRRRGLGTRHGFDGDTDGQRIDWILASYQFDAISAAIKRYHEGGRYPSDHFPVTAVLHWPTVTADASKPEAGDGRL